MVPFWCLSSLFKWGENHPMTRMVAIRRDILLGASLQSACYRHDEVRNPMGCLFFHSALEVNPVSFSRYVAARIWLLGSCLLTQPKYYIYIYNIIYIIIYIYTWICVNSSEGSHLFFPPFYPCSWFFDGIPPGLEQRSARFRSRGTAGNQWTCRWHESLGRPEIWIDLEQGWMRSNLGHQDL